MTRSTENQNRLFQERLESVELAAPQWPGMLYDLCSAFERATGWSLAYMPGHPPQDDHDLMWSAPVGPGVGASPGHLRIDLGGPELRERGPVVELDLATELAGAIAGLIGRLSVAHEELRKREAELAAGIPVVERESERPHLAERLEAVLRGGAQAVECHAAAVYLLDSATSELKLRAAYGLPRERLASPARALRAATADLEALAGHAVVMKNRAIRAEWSAPEAAAAAVCVPISSATMPLGTLWLFSAREREFTDEQVNLIEIVAGRLASDLEREVMMQESLNAATLKRQLADAERLQELQVPRALPASNAWELDAWTSRADRLTGDFYDWVPQADGRVSVAVGSTSGSGIAAAMLSGMLRTSIRSHAEAGSAPQHLLERINHDLWGVAAGLQWASLGYALLGDEGRMEMATAGDVAVIVARRSGWQLLSRASMALARDPSTRYRPIEHLLRSDEALLMLAGGEFGDAVDGKWDLSAIASEAARTINQPARDISGVLRRRFGFSPAAPAAATSIALPASAARQGTLLVVKRRMR